MKTLTTNELLNVIKNRDNDNNDTENDNNKHTFDLFFDIKDELIKDNKDDNQSQRSN